MCRVTELPDAPVRRGLPAGKKGTRLPRERRAHSAPRQAEHTWAVTRFPRQPAHRPESFPSDIEDGDRPPGDEEELDSGCQFQFQIWPGASEEHLADERESHTSDRRRARNQGERVRRGHPWL